MAEAPKSKLAKLFMGMSGDYETAVAIRHVRL